MDGLQLKIHFDHVSALFSLTPLTQPFLPPFSLHLPLFLKSYHSFFFLTMTATLSVFLIVQ